MTVCKEQKSADLKGHAQLKTKSDLHEVITKILH